MSSTRPKVEDISQSLLDDTLSDNTFFTAEKPESTERKDVKSKGPDLSENLTHDYIPLPTDIEEKPKQTILGGKALIISTEEPEFHDLAPSAPRARHIPPGEEQSVDLDDKKAISSDYVEIKADLTRSVSTANLRGEPNFPTQCRPLKVTVAHLTYALTPISFAMNAFVGPTGIKLEELTWENFSNLGWGQKTLAFSCGISSEVINYFFNASNIPDALTYLSKLNFGKHKLRNIAILILSTGAAVAAGAIGYSSLAFAGRGAAIANAGASTFLFWVTRFYGLANLSHRFTKYREMGSFEDLVKRLLSDDVALEKLAIEYATVMTGHIQAYKADKTVTPAMVEDLIRSLLIMMRDNPRFELKKKANSDYFFEVLNWTLATIGALSVAPTFAQKFIDGLSKLDPTGTIENGNVYLKGFFGILFSSASPLMFANAISKVGGTFSETWESLSDSSTSVWKKIGAPFIFVANGLASMSGYNLNKGVAENAGVFKNLFPFGSKQEWFTRLVATAGTLTVNASGVCSYVFPPKEDSNAIELKDWKETSLSEEAQFMKILTEEALKWMRKPKNEFSDEALEKLNMFKDGADKTEKARKLHEKKSEAPAIVADDDKDYVMIEGAGSPRQKLPKAKKAGIKKEPENKEGKPIKKNVSFTLPDGKKAMPGVPSPLQSPLLSRREAARSEDLSPKTPEPDEPVLDLDKVGIETPRGPGL